MGNVLCKGLFGRKSKAVSDDDDEIAGPTRVDSIVRRSSSQHSPPSAIPGGEHGESLATTAARKFSGSAGLTVKPHQQISPQLSSTSGVSSFSGDDIDGVLGQRRPRRRSSLPSTPCPDEHPALSPRMSAVRRSVGADSQLLRDQINARLETYSNTIVALTMLIQHMTTTAKSNFAVARRQAVDLQKHCAEKDDIINELQSLLQEKQVPPTPEVHDTHTQTEIIDTLRETLPPLDQNATRQQLLDDHESLRHVIRMHREEIRGLRAERVELLRKREQLHVVERLAEQRLAKIEELQATLEAKDCHIRDHRRRVQLLEDEVRQLEALIERAHIDKDLLQWRLLHDTSSNSGDSVATPRLMKRRASSVTDLSSCCELVDPTAGYLVNRLERELSNSHADSLTDGEEKSCESLNLESKTVCDFRRGHGGLAYRILDPQPLTPSGLKKRHLVEVSGKRSLSTSRKVKPTVHKSESCVSASTTQRYGKAIRHRANTTHSSSIVGRKSAEHPASSHTAHFKNTAYTSCRKELFSRQ